MATLTLEGLIAPTDVVAGAQAAGARDVLEKLAAIGAARTGAPERAILDSLVAR